MGKKLLLANAHVPGIKGYEVYRREGGYLSVEKALKMTPADIVEEVKKSGLRGRGGAGFPAGMKWSFIAKPEGVPRHLVVNADESEPGTFKDRYLMEFLPHLLIEGMIVSSFALGSNTSYIYIRGEYAWIVDILEQAISEAKQNGFLGKNILGTGFDCEIYIQRGAGAYICGEETALIESLEGMIVSSYALGSHMNYIYIRGEYDWIATILENAIAEAKQNGWLGKNIQGSGFDCEIYVHRGAGAYICGEETALIESL
ncbi:MAG: hypothetical protein ABIY51_10725, partial [Ferruginibacter sp.]